MSKNTQFMSLVLLLALFVGASFFAATSYVSAHEKAHAKTCLYFGGTPDITYSNFGLNGETMCLDADIPERHMADALIEGFGYQVQAYSGSSIMFNVLLFSVLIIILARDMVKSGVLK